MEKSFENYRRGCANNFLHVRSLYFQKGRVMKSVRNKFCDSSRKLLNHFGKRKNFTKHYLFLCIAITTAIVLYVGCFCYNSLFRLVSSVADVATSFAYYFVNFVCVLTGADNPVSATVIQVPFTSENALLPQQYEQFVAKINGFWSTFISEKNVANFFSEFPNKLYNVAVVLMFLLPILVICFVLLKLPLSGQNDATDVPTKQLLSWFWVEKFVLQPVKDFFRGFVSYVNKHDKFRTAWLLLTLLGMNVFTYVLEVFAYALYFVSSFDVVNIYTQAYKLFVDLDVTFSSLPAVLWAPILWYLVVLIRTHIGKNKWHHMENCNFGYVKSFGVCTMITGNMGTGKTKLMTDMALTISSEYKFSCKNIMFDVERWFPFFPWATLQNELKNAFHSHDLYSLTTAEVYAKTVRKQFETFPCKANLFGYDFLQYGLYYNNQLQMLYLFDLLEEYCKAFFVYYVSSSLIVGNYSIREDGICEDLGNMPMWNFDFLERSPDLEWEQSYFSHVLDFDVLRKGKKVVQGSKFADTFEFGIVTITELDKERGNTIDTRELKKNTNEANQKNDLFNYSPKMGRHPSTIMFQPFVRFLVDQQRAMKTDADFREICDKVLNIEDVKKDKLCLPLFFVEDFVFSIAKPLFDSIYTSYRFNRGDNTLFMYFLKKTLVKFLNWYERQYNLYGYDEYKLSTDSGKLDGDKVQTDKYFLLHKKALSHRYATDCYKDFFRAKSLQKNIGIVDYPTFAGVTATSDELKSMNSYFINDMITKICAEDEEKGE